MEVVGLGMYYEDLPVGRQFKTVGRTITEPDIVNFVNTTGMVEVLFTNLEFLKEESDIKQRLDLYERLMRLDKPIGTLLLLWPTLWALWVASRGNPPWPVVLIFAVGTLLMRSAGCVMNDIADRDFDPHGRMIYDTSPMAVMNGADNAEAVPPSGAEGKVVR